MKRAQVVFATLVSGLAVGCWLPSPPKNPTPMAWSRFSPGDGMIIAGAVTSSTGQTQRTVLGFVEDRYHFMVLLDAEDGYVHVPPGRYRLGRIHLGPTCWSLDTPAFEVKSRRRLVMPALEVRGAGRYECTLRRVGTGTTAFAAFEARFADAPWTGTETVAVDLGESRMRRCEQLR